MPKRERIKVQFVKFPDGWHALLDSPKHLSKLNEIFLDLQKQKVVRK